MTEQHALRKSFVPVVQRHSVDIATLAKMSPGKDGQMWTLVIVSKEPDMSLRTKVQPTWTISHTLEQIRKKFPEGTTDSCLFFETEKNFLLLEANAQLSSFEELGDNVELRLAEKSFKGTPQKPVRYYIGQAQKVTKTPSSDSLTSVKEVKHAPPAKKSLYRNQSLRYMDAAFLEDFMKNVISKSKVILGDMKTIRDYISNGTNHTVDELFEIAKKTAQTTVELVTLVEKQKGLASNTQFSVIKDSAKKVQSKVLVLLQHTQSWASNPFDFLLRQKFSAASNDVVECIKVLIDETDSLTEDEKEEDPAMQEKMAKDAVRATKELHGTLKAIQDAVEKQDKNIYVASTRTLVMSVNELLQILQSLALNDLYHYLKAATTNYVNASKAAISYADPLFKSRLAETEAELRKHVRSFVITSANKNKEIQRAVRKKQFIEFYQIYEDPAKERDYNAKMHVAGKITLLFSEHFEMFRKQWRKLSSNEMEDFMEAIVSEISEGNLAFQQKFEQLTSSKSDTIGKSSDEEIDAMKELQKIMQMNNASDWQQMALNLRRLNTKLGGKQNLDLDLNLNDLSLADQITKISSLLSDTTVNLMIIFFDNILSPEEGVVIDFQKQSETFVKFIQNLLKEIRKCVDILQIWMRGNNKKEDVTTDSTVKQWAIPVEFTHGNIRVMKKIKFDPNMTAVQAVARILDKIDITDKKVEYGLSIPSEKSWIQPDKKLVDYPQLASEKVALELKIADVHDSLQRKLILTIIEQLASTIENMPSRGTILNNMVSALTDPKTGEPIANYTSVKMKLQEGLQDIVYNESNGLRVLIIQIISGLRVLSGTSSLMKNYSTLIQTISSVKQTVPALQAAMNAFETFAYIYVNCNEQSVLGTSESIHLNTITSEDDLEDIWAADPNLAIHDEKGFRGGNLNHLIIQLTQDDTMDNSFMTTFITTYQSFTTAERVLQKLMNRYACPEGSLSPDKKRRIQLKVLIVIKYWIEKQFDDFDRRSVNMLATFINTRLDGNESFVKTLNEELFKKMEQRKARRKIQGLELADIKIHDEGRSQLDLFMALNESEIARQLTLIEFKMFAKIKSSELLNQSWNKTKLQHKAPNILAMISRANKLSFWVASMILLFARLKDRSRVLMKMLVIAEHLLALGNFNTLMGLLAGVNVSSVSRLKHTWDDLHPNQQLTYKNVTALFDPSGSFRAYRQVLLVAQGKGPVLPYLGQYLSDLTFCEEGNPDFLTTRSERKLINWGKHQLIGGIVKEIKNMQQSSYDIPPVEPINTYLTELSHLEEEELYSLSLLREPRQTELKDILV